MIVEGARRINCELSGRKVTGKIDHFLEAASRAELRGVTAMWRVGGIGSSSGSSV
jgi:hypothetical protein